MSTDWMPGRREEQLLLAQKWLFELPKPQGKWDVSQAEHEELANLIEGVQYALADQAQNAGPVENSRVREAYKALVRYMRWLHGRKFFSPPMIDSDWIRLGLKPPDTVRTEHIEVPEFVEFELKLRGIREIVVNFWVKGSASRAKPEGYDGAVLVWDTLNAPPERPTDLAEHTMASKTPHVLEFDETERGKTVYVAAQWQNERGHTGAWSEIQSAIVP